MARGSKLTARAVAALSAPGRYRVDDGLYLQVSKTGTKAWLFRFMLAGKAREMGLGPAGEPPKAVSLALARERTAECYALLREGRDPIEARQEAKRVAEAEAARAAVNSFRAVAEAMISAREAAWRNTKHRQQWRSTLATYAYPVIGDMAVAAVGTEEVLRVLRPIWTEKPETASRLRGRVERVLAYAKTLQLRGGENPAAWRGHLSEALASPRQLKTTQHHPALPWQQMSDFMAQLRGREGLSARALEFTILTAARSGETLGARWREVDLDAGVWNVPATRMKMKREHRVPLSPAVLTLLRAVLPLSNGPESFVFPGQNRGRGLVAMATRDLLERMNRQAEGEPPRWRDGRTGESITTHGFRSAFRDWCGEASHHPPDLAEAALAHINRDKTEAAYARGDLFAKRAVLMADWAAFCAGLPAEVVAMQAARSSGGH
jgi:integrase